MEKQKWMKPDTMKKLHRNFLLRDYATSHPELSFAQIGKIFRISRQRVSIIMKDGTKMNLQTLILTCLVILLGEEGKHWVTYGGDLEWWTLRLYTRIN